MDPTQQSSFDSYRQTSAPMIGENNRVFLTRLVAMVRYLDLTERNDRMAPLDHCGLDPEATLALQSCSLGPANAVRVPVGDHRRIAIRCVPDSALRGGVAADERLRRAPLPFEQVVTVRDGERKSQPGRIEDGEADGVLDQFITQTRSAPTGERLAVTAGDGDAL
jgi:hypothetical protein